MPAARPAAATPATTIRLRRERLIGMVYIVAEKTVNLSSADRVLFPDDGITKGDLFNYYDKVADTIIPHLRDRPFTMKRWREGLPGGSFFQKQAPKGIPDWLPTRQFRTYPREGG